MKLDKRGMTIIEILISVVLVSVVLMFLFRLLVELRSEDEKTEYVVKNQLNRAELIDLVEKDLNKYIVKYVKDNSDDSSDIIELVFGLSNQNETNDAILKVYTKENNNSLKYYVSYKDYNQVTSTYEMINARVSNCGTWKYNSNSELNYFIINIPIYNLIPNDNNIEKRNNLVDDLIITNYRKSQIENVAQSLTNYGFYSIGKNCNH